MRADALGFRERLVLAALLAGAAALHVATALRVPVGEIIDDAVYLLLARALGRGSYVLPDGLGLPVTSFWPGTPLLYALPARLFEPHWGLCRIPALLWSWAALGLSWKLAREHLPAAWAAACVLLVAWNPVFVMNAGIAASDLPFLALSLAAFCALPAAGQRRRPALLELAAALAGLMRPEGILLALSLSLALAWREGPRRALAFLAVALAPAAAWLLRNHMLAGSASDYARQMASQMPALWNMNSQLAHAGRLAAVLFGRDLLGWEGSGPAAVASGVVVLAAAGGGAVALLRRNGDSRVLAMAAYGILIVCLHLLWWQILDRYLLALLPLVWILALAGARAWALRRAASQALYGAAAALFLLIISDARQLARASARGSELWPQTMAWLSANTAPDALLQSPYAPPLMLWTGRRAITPFLDVALRDHWLAKCINNKVEYLVLDEGLLRWGRMPEPWLDPLRLLSLWAGSSRYVSEAFRGPGEGVVVYRIHHPEPGRYLKAWQAYREAFMATGKPAFIIAKLREAVRLEPELACAWTALADLDREPGSGPARARALRADPTAEEAAAVLRQSQAEGY